MFIIKKRMINYGNRIFKQEDYLIPNLYSEKEEDYDKIGKYEILRLYFIIQNKQAIYETLLMTDKLAHHFILVNILLSISKTIDFALFILLIWLWIKSTLLFWASDAYFSLPL